VERSPASYKFGQALAVLVLFFTLGLIGFLVWKLGSLLSSSLLSAIAVPSLTVLASVGTLVYSKREEQRRAIDAELRKQKLPVYEEFIQFIFRVTFEGKPGVKPFEQDEMIKFFVRFTPQLVIWGSDELIREYGNFREVSRAEGNNLVLLVESVERLLLAIRKDLGHKNEKLGRGDLLVTFINDAKVFLRP
jgi:hypothetical protein